MTITFSICNVTSDLVDKIILRKFFQMVFLGNDKKSLHIYTATILGASNDEKNPDQDIPFISDLKTLSPFRMHFDFAIGSNDSNEVLSIKHENLTDSEHGFLREIDCVRKVWGNKCKIITGNQKEILDRLKIIYKDDNKVFSEDEKLITANLTKYKLLWTEQKKNTVPSHLLHSLSIEGDFQEVEDHSEADLKDGVFVRKSYAVSVPQDTELPIGIELVNWVCTTITFKYGLDDTNLNYIIRNDNNSTKVFAPDFTWYFSPIVKSFIDNRNCMVEIKRGNAGGETDCICPIQNKRRTFYTSDKYQNSIDGVPNKLTVNFYHWKEDEKINSRQKYRLAAKDILPNYDSFAEVSEISIFLDTADEHNRGNRQFILGVFISFALAFGIDSARLQDISYCFSPLNRWIPEDICWLIFLTLFSLTLMNKPAKLSENSRRMLIFRKVIMICSLAWIGIVYGLFRSSFIKQLINPLQSKWGTIMGIALLLVGISHFIYLNLCKVDAKDSLWVDLFGEDIL